MNQQDDREDDKQAESLADLPVADEQADEVRGGPLTVMVPIAAPVKLVP